MANSSPGNDGAATMKPSEPSEPADRRVRVLSAVTEVEARDWNACAGLDNPFVSHQFLSALEASGCACGETGWLPHHLVAYHGSRLVAVAPTYLKSHSFGEYIWDHSWAELSARLGKAYYPKLQVAVPFTPVPGPRLLSQDPEGIETLALGLAQLSKEQGLSGAHITFAQGQELECLRGLGYLTRWGHQYHWFNDNYQNFEEFLGRLTSRKRKAIRKERRRARSHGLDLQVLSGSQLTEEVLDRFYAFYIHTCSQKWGRPYLNREFFSELRKRMPEQLVLFMAADHGRWVAGAWNLVGQRALYGRNWGCLGFYDCLHFELCYYQAIEFAIERGLSRVEAGAQGMHKIQRGYQPVKTFSAHFLVDPELRMLIGSYLAQERSAVEEDIDTLREHIPFKTP